MTILISLILAITTPVFPGESIQDALDTSLAGDTVLVMPGVHHGTGEHLIALTADHNGIVLLGNELMPGEVILSGDSLLDSIIDIDCTESGSIDTTMVISGFLFTGGNSTIDAFGGAIHTKHSSPLIKHSLFNDCTADNGGAIYCWKGSPVIRYCSFQGNECLSAGGAIYLYTANASVSNSTFYENVSWDDGGAVFCYHSSPIIFNCIFEGGYAHDDGGAIYCYALSNPEVSFCTIANNYSLYTGSAIYFRVGSSPLIHHNIVTGNTGGPAFYIQDGGEPQFEYNCTWGNPEGNYGNLPDPTGTSGNISSDPLFVNGFFLSQTAAGQNEESPCVDSGEGIPGEYNLDLTWTRTDSIPDSSLVDIGFHHRSNGDSSGSHPEGTTTLNIYPNPTPGYVTVTLPDYSDFSFLEVYDLTGRKIFTKRICNGSITIDLAGESSSAVYLVRVIEANSAGYLTGRITVLRN